MTITELKDICADAYEYSKAFESTSGTQGNRLVDWAIDALYQDFESRICENCSYWDSNEQCELIEDDPYDIWAAIQNIVTEPTFGCNKFKRKKK